jgi:hypothetical protein
MHHNHLGAAGAGGGMRRPGAPFCDPQRLLDNGWHPVPLQRVSKGPAVSGWNRFALVPPREDLVARWVAKFPRCGWGLVCGGCAVAVDNDCDTPEASALFEAVRLCVLGETPAVRLGKPGRSLALYRPAEPVRYANLTTVGGEIHGLNADLVTGRQVAIFGPHPTAPSGRYVWPVEDLQALRPGDLPPVSAAQIARFTETTTVEFILAGLARPAAMRRGGPGVLDRAAARAVRRAARYGASAALAEAERVMRDAAAALRAGVAVARHPLGLAVALEAVRAGCSPEQVADRLDAAWMGLLGERERRARAGELLALAHWAEKKVCRA